ncbi:MAG: MAPEG family protein [Alphaproteobacteria bacterium]
MPLITPLYAALAAAVLIVLSVRVIGVRRSRQLAIGDGADDDMARRIRAQGNFAEYTPLALLLILLLEFGGAAAWQLHLLGAALILGRIVHAWSLTAHSGNGRLTGMVLTFVVLAAGALGNLKTAFGPAFL